MILFSAKPSAVGHQILIPYFFLAYRLIITMFSSILYTQNHVWLRCAGLNLRYKMRNLRHCFARQIPISANLSVSNMPLLNPDSRKPSCIHQSQIKVFMFSIHSVNTLFNYCKFSFLKSLENLPRLFDLALEVTTRFFLNKILVRTPPGSF